jgi:F-type H+-transporting ATPase subunit beta/protein regulator of cytokinesis 1
VLLLQLQDQKKIQDQIKAEQEALYGSKPSPSKPQSTKKVPRNSMGGANRRLSLGGATMQAPKTDILHSKTARAAKKTEELGTLSPSKFHSPFIYINAAAFVFPSSSTILRLP